jgi:transposase
MTLREIRYRTFPHGWAFWPWLRPHRGISQEKLPLYLGFFQFVHNTRRRGKALLGSLIEALVT